MVLLDPHSWRTKVSLSLITIDIPDNNRYPYLSDAYILDIILALKCLKFNFTVFYQVTAFLQLSNEE